MNERRAGDFAIVVRVGLSLLVLRSQTLSGKQEGRLTPTSIGTGQFLVGHTGEYPLIDVARTH